MKRADKLIAQKLRKQGKSYNEILRVVNVSKSTLSIWLKDIQLTREQEHRLYFTLKQNNALKLAKRKQAVKQALIRKITLDSFHSYRELLKNDIFIPGLMIYWAEGDKIKTNEAVKVSNADPAIITLMMKWFREICKVPESKFRIALHIHTLHCNKDVIKYWSNITNIPIEQFHKTQIKKTTLKHRKNPLYNGACSIRVYDKNLFRKIMGWKLAFQQNNDLIP